MTTSAANTDASTHGGTMEEGTTIAALERRVFELEALVARLAADRPGGAADPPVAAPTPVVSAVESTTSTERAPGLDRRRLLTRGGTAAVGAVLGGAVASIATASPAAAATGTFDTTDGTPALSATTSGSGAAIEATSNSGAKALTVTGRSTLDAEGNVMEVNATGPNAVGVWTHSDNAGAILGGTRIGAWAFGERGLLAQGDKLGIFVGGGTAQMYFVTDSLPMPPPPTRTDDHQMGELYLDVDGCMWLCLADGAPGTWTRLGGAGTTGALTMLASPVRVYDSRTGYPPSVGPKTPLAPGVDRVIDCTANTSSIPTDATAAIVTITIANPTGPGWLAARANEAPYTGTSTLNWTAPGAVIATTTTTALGPQATIALRTMTTTDTIVDVIGYHR